jgi:hypothetical protein
LDVDLSGKLAAFMAHYVLVKEFERIMLAGAIRDNCTLSAKGDLTCCGRRGMPKRDAKSSNRVTGKNSVRTINSPSVYRKLSTVELKIDREARETKLIAGSRTKEPTARNYSLQEAPRSRYAKIAGEWSANRK